MQDLIDAAASWASKQIIQFPRSMTNVVVFGAWRAHAMDHPVPP